MVIDKLHNVNTAVIENLWGVFYAIGIKYLKMASLFTFFRRVFQK